LWHISGGIRIILGRIRLTHVGWYLWHGIIWNVWLLSYSLSGIALILRKSTKGRRLTHGSILTCLLSLLLILRRGGIDWHIDWRGRALMTAVHVLLRWVSITR
jgi:hypothetical protein